jgi:hypothetical protein
MPRRDVTKSANKKDSVMTDIRCFNNLERPSYSFISGGFADGTARYRLVF